MRLAATGHGLLLVVDDLHEADEASLRLLHYLSRCAVSEPVADRGRPPARVADEPRRTWPRASSAAGTGPRIELAPLDRRATRRLLARPVPGPAGRPGREIWAGQRRAAVPGARAARRATRSGDAAVLSGRCRPRCRRRSSASALLGSAFTTDELLALVRRRRGRTLPTSSRRRCPPVVVEPAEAGYRFRHALVREALLETMLAAPALAGAARGRRAARRPRRAARPGGPPLPRRRPTRARRARTPLRAVETAGALGAYRDGLAPDRRRPRPRRPGTTCRGCSPAEATCSSRSATRRRSTAYQEARRRHHRHRAPAGAGPAGPRGGFAGDLDTARAALAGLELGGRRRRRADPAGARATSRTSPATSTPPGRSPTRPAALLQLTGRPVAARGPGLAAGSDRAPPRRVVRAVPAGAAAHAGQPALATALFDAHLCVAEYLLYGPIPYDEVIEQAEELPPPRRPGGRAARRRVRDTR